MFGLTSGETIVLSMIVALVFGGLVAPLAGRKWGKVLSMLAMGYTLLAIVALLPLVTGQVVFFKGLVVVDSFSLILALGLTAALLITAIGAVDPSSDWGAVEGLYAVLAIMLLGILAVSFSTNMVTAYASWILAAAASYIVVAMRKDWVSAEAAVKYAILGGVASSLIVLGLGYLYTITHSVNIVQSQIVYGDPLFVATLTVILLTSIGYKMGVVPFQGWLPDVYGNARPVLVAFIAPAAKVLAILLLIRLLIPVLETGQPQLLASYASLALILAIATMTYGNLAGVNAAVRDKPQLALAYSSIAQAGYLLVGLAALAGLPGMNRGYAILGLTLHTIGYVFSKAAVFTGLDVAKHSNNGILKGLWRKDPYSATGIALGLMSLMGMPPFLGFWGKLYIVLSIVEYSPLIAVIMAINFAIAAYYYAKLIYPLFSEGEKGEIYDSRSVASLANGILALMLGLVPWIASAAVIAGLAAP